MQPRRSVAERWLLATANAGTASDARAAVGALSAGNAVNPRMRPYTMLSWRIDRPERSAPPAEGLGAESWTTPRVAWMGARDAGRKAV